MRRLIFGLCLLAVPGWAFGQTWECREVMVPMRDGVELATDLYRPARDGQPIEKANSRLVRM